jgi:succinate dehydrogenase / fumarate reductase cytochrome b subunit
VAIPLVLFVIAHLTLAATGFWPTWYQANVSRIHRLGSALPPLEIICVFLPLLMQIYFGVKLLCKAGLKFRTDKHHRGGHTRFFLQRTSAIVMLLFLLFHVATFHRWGLHSLHQAMGTGFLAHDAGEGIFDAGHAYESTTAGIAAFWGNGISHSLANSWTAGFYLAGIWATCYHVANGLATGGVAWGLTMTDRAQRAVNRVCFLSGMALLVLGTAAWRAFV